MQILLALYFYLSVTGLVKATRYHGCNWRRVGGLDGRPYKCDLKGASYKGEAVIPEYYVTPRNNLTAMQLCEYACAESVKCKAWSFYKLFSTCQLYSKPIEKIGFEPQRDSKRFYSNRVCTGGEPVGCPQNPALKAEFNGQGQGPFNIKGGKENVNWGRKDGHCDGGNGFDGAFWAQPATNTSSVSMTTLLNLPQTDVQHRLTFDYVYEELDSSNIIFGYLFENEKSSSGISQVFQLARADEGDKVGFWQQSSSTISARRIKKYKLQINFEFIPTAPVKKRVMWRFDKVCLTKVTGKGD